MVVGGAKLLPSGGGARAEVYWKVDDHGRILWTHGYARWPSL